MNELETKPWGVTRKVESSLTKSVHELRLNRGGFCSFHYHKVKTNRFIVDSGLVRVVWSIGFVLKHLDLSEGDILVIDPMICHQFQVLESGNMIEEYTGPYVVDSDIERLSAGGLTAIDHNEVRIIMAGLEEQVPR